MNHLHWMTRTANLQVIQSQLRLKTPMLVSRRILLQVASLTDYWLGRFDQTEKSLPGRQRQTYR
jgi:hypothetical protein